MSYQSLNKFSLPPKFRGRSAFTVQLWWIVQSTLFSWSPQIAYRWRVFLLRLFGAKIGKNVIIRPSVVVTYPWKLEIGDYAWIGDGVTLYSLGSIKIGKNTVVSQKSYICAGSHDYSAETFDILAISVVIEEEVWVATDVFIAPGVKISKGAVIGARSSVFDDIPNASICFGNPAKPYKRRIETSK